MKKCRLILFGTILLVSLSACGPKIETGNGDDRPNLIPGTDIESSGNKEIDELMVDIQKKAPLNLEDLDRIDEINFPKSYLYETYNWEQGGDGPTKTGEYIYPDDISHRLLLPIHENIVERNLVSSLMEDDKVNTTIDATLDDGTMCSISYVTDSYTLRYVSAVVNTPEETIFYTFDY